MRNHSPLLQAEGVSKSYDGSWALQGVDFEILQGEVHALTGENGAGKSTLVNVLSGMTSADAGEIRIDGRPLHDLTPNMARALGIAVVHQDFDLAPNLTVAENLFLGDEPKWFPSLVNKRREQEQARTRLDTVGLDIHPDTPVGDLSVAQRQLVAIAKAISSPVRLLILDEPTSTLAADDTRHLLDLIRQRKAAGTSVLFISHKLDEVFGIADRVSVFRDGCNVGTRRIPDTSTSEVVGMMVGRELAAPHRGKPVLQQNVCLRISGLEAAGLGGGFDLSLRHGEVLGLYGLKGSGRSVLLRALFGLTRRRGGEILIDGKPSAIHSPLQAIRKGLAWVCRDRKERGLFPNLDVQANLTLPALDSLSRFGFVLRGKERRATLKQIESLGIRTAGPDQPITALSGGNQQKVMLARWLLCAPRVLVLDEPTAGIDVGAKAEIYALVRRLTAAGMGILLVSSELPEVLALSDRILVMHEGALAGILDAEDASEQKVMQLIHAGSLGTKGSWS